MAKLTGVQRAEIIAAHVEGESNVSLAGRYGVTETTIRNVVKEDPETSKKFELKKEENIRSLYAFMDSQMGDVCAAIAKLLKAIGDPKKIDKASVPQLATALGILVDKYTASERNKAKAQDAGEWEKLIAGMVEHE